MSEVLFSGLDIAARRLRMSTCDRLAWFEAVLHAYGCGWNEREAMTMTLREVLQRKGLYCGILKTLVDSGEVFQMTEDEPAQLHREQGTGRAIKGLQKGQERNGCNDDTSAVQLEFAARLVPPPGMVEDLEKALGAINR